MKRKVLIFLIFPIVAALVILALILLLINVENLGPIEYKIFGDLKPSDTIFRHSVLVTETEVTSFAVQAVKISSFASSQKLDQASKYRIKASQS